MVCPRCGATFEGRFCPQCGAAASAVPPAPLAFSVTCPRCGSAFQGNFCPQCGLPAGAAPFLPAAPPTEPSGVNRVLSVLWTLALAGFLVFIGMNFAGLVLSPTAVVPGVQGISFGQDVNQDLAAGSANWTFLALNGSAATGAYAPSGGNPGGYLAMALPAGGSSGGEWVQAIHVTGSAPFVGEMHLDVRAGVSGVLAVALETSATGLDFGQAAALIPVTAGASWTTTADVDVSGSLGAPGTYYLKVAFVTPSTAASAEVGFDNIHLAWTTDAYFFLYLPLPLPMLLYISSDPGQFLAYYAFIVAALLASGLWYTLHDRKRLVAAFKAPLDDIAARLRSSAAWVSIGQVFLATTFYQLALIALFALVGVSAASPISETATNGWTLIFELSAASVFEEIAFRAFLIGVPMAAAALLWRLARRRPPVPGAPPSDSQARYLGALRYLWGGQLRRDSPREARILGTVLLVLSSTLFGLAHALGGGWGWWKVLPALVAGLGMGYVFLRHGLGASILVHFATDGSEALYLEGVGGLGLAIFTNLFLIGLAIAGTGFFAWYVLYAWDEVQALRRGGGAHVVRQPAPTAPATTPPGGYAPPTAALPGPSYGVPPPPPPYAPPASGWPTPPPQAPAPVRPSPQLPQGYAPTYHPPPYGYPPVRFQCPFCGWVEARYENRAFTCLRCGRTA